MSMAQAVKKENPMGYMPIGKLLLQFSIPSIIAILIQFVYNVVDQIFIGQGVGYLGNAATTVSLPIMTIMTGITTFLGTGGSAFAAIKMGQKQEDLAEVALNNTFLLAIGAGILYAILGLTFLEPLLRLFGATENVMPYAKDYASILLAASPIAILGPCMSNFARADGKPQLAMYSVLTGAILNSILDPIYIFVLHWGVKGAAIATVTAQTISVIIMCTYFFKHGSIRLRGRQMRLQPSICSQMMTLGTASAISQVVVCIMQVVMNNSLNYYGDQSPIGGDIALSAMGIVMKIGMIMSSVCLGIGVGAQAIFGYNFGAQRYDRVKKLYITAVKAATVSLLVGWAVCELFPEPIIRIFGGGNQMFIDFAVRSLRFYPAAIFLAGFQIVSANYFQATGQPMKASILSMLRQLILLVPMLLILPRFFGVDGILYAGPITDAGTAIVVLFLMLPEMKKLDRQIQEMPPQPEQCV